jgi:hypothetical protein
MPLSAKAVVREARTLASAKKSEVGKMLTVVKREAHDAGFVRLVLRVVRNTVNRA